jgi:hypothetical protein
MNQLTLVDPVSLAVFVRPIGGTGGSDQAQTPATTSPPTPTVTPDINPGQVPGGGAGSTVPGSGGGGTGGGSGETTQPRPDLLPTRILYDQADLVAGKAIFFDSGVENTGDAATGTFNIKWYVDGKDVGAYGSHSGLAAGSTVLNGNSQFTWTLPAGSHKITFAVDVDDFIPESNEDNNSTSVTVAVQ